MNKKIARLRRAKRTRARIRAQGLHRLCVHRTPRHTYAQVIASEGGKVLTSVSTVEPAIRQEVSRGGNAGAAAVLGRLIAERAQAVGVKRVAFDRSGYKYHGRVEALANAARQHGLEL